MHGKSKLQSFLMISKLKRTFLVRCHVNWIQINLIESFSKLLKALENLNSSGYLHNSPKTLIPAANVDYASISYSRKRNKSKNFTCILHKTTPTMYLNGYWCKSYYWINVLIKISNVSFKLQQLNCVIEFKKVSRKIHNTLHRWCALEWVVLLNVQCGENMRI